VRTVGNLMRLIKVGAFVAAVLALVLVTAAQADSPGPPSGDGVQPTLVEGNPTCSTLDPGTNELRVEPVADGTYTDDDGPLSVTIDVRSTPDGPVVDFTSHIAVDSVFVKGGNRGNFYVYEPPAENASDTALHAPVNDDNNTFFGLSHLLFCYDVEEDGTLTVIKRVVNDDGGTAVPSDWTMVVSGPESLQFPGASDPGTTSSLMEGEYTITESGGPAGYVLTYGGECAPNGVVTVPAGHNHTCILVNDDQPGTPPPGSLIVKKVVINDDGGTKIASDFTFRVNAGAPQAFEADGQNDLAVAAGTYSVVEPSVPGYATTYDNCLSVVVPSGGSATCTITNDDMPPGVTGGVGAISVSKSADPTTLKEPGGPVAYSVRITNPSSVDITVENVVDDKFGDLDDSGGSGCFDVPINLAPGASSSCQFTKQIAGSGGTSHVNTVTATGHDENGNALSGSASARVDITPELIDLVVVKDASSPTPLNGTVTYSLAVTNKGPDTATNVQLADPAPAGISYLTATPSQGTCSVTPALVTCSLGTIVAGQTVTVGVTGKATQVGTHTNTATVTGAGGRETNPADNVDDAVTVVPAPIVPPTPKPKPKPKSNACLAVTVTPKLIRADGKPDRLVVRVTAAGKAVKQAKVLVRGSGVRKTVSTNNRGVAVARVNAPRPGLVTVTTLERQHVCGIKRIGVVGVFLPPVTG
jgi:uncharacterized repeat protein (TIGR01451 family)